MIDIIATTLSAVSPEFATVILAMLPLTELRASLPLAMTVFDLSVIDAYLYSMIGNIIPLFVLLWGLPPIIAFAKKHSPSLDRLFTKFLGYYEKKYKDRYQKYGRLILFLFTMIPLPGSGVWTASLLAVIFNIKRSYAVQAITFGMLAAGIIVALITSGVLGGLSFLL
jgi:uncharacterized membrane protein